MCNTEGTACSSPGKVQGILLIEVGYTSKSVNLQDTDAQSNMSTQTYIYLYMSSGHTYITCSNGAYIYYMQ